MGYGICYRPRVELFWWDLFERIWDLWFVFEWVESWVEWWSGTLRNEWALWFDHMILYGVLVGWGSELECCVVRSAVSHFHFILCWNWKSSMFGISVGSEDDSIRICLSMKKILVSWALYKWISADVSCFKLSIFNDYQLIVRRRAWLKFYNPIGFQLDTFASCCAQQLSSIHRRMDANTERRGKQMSLRFVLLLFVPCVSKPVLKEF